MALIAQVIRTFGRNSKIGGSSPPQVEIFCLWNFDSFIRKSFRESKMNVVTCAQLTFQMLTTKRIIELPISSYTPTPTHTRTRTHTRKHIATWIANTYSSSRIDILSWAIAPRLDIYILIYNDCTVVHAVSSIRTIEFGYQKAFPFYG